jgi:hypothetical protein
MLAGTSGQKGVLRAHVEILQESIRRNLDQVPISDLLRKVRNNRNEVRCETDIKPILQPLRATVAHVRLIHRVCSRFAGRDRPTFRDASLNFTQVDSRLEGYCSDEMEKSRERLVKPQELYDTLLRELPDCTRDWPR